MAAAIATTALVVPAGGAGARTVKTKGPVMYYLSLGDSYSVGFQPLPTPGATAGYTAVVAAKEHMTLENFGCGGATTSSILSFPEAQCGITQYGPPAATNVGPSSGTQTQAQAAEAFIAAHPGQIGLVTVSIGGNDVTACAGASNPVSCVTAALGPVQTNVESLVGGLRSALVAADGTMAGDAVPIVGLTYPDVLLGLFVNSGPAGSPPNTPAFPASTANVQLAVESVLVFQTYLNPFLQAAYASVGGKFADVTTKTGAYGSLVRTRPMDIAALGLGTIMVPKPVEKVCMLTWYCQLGNIHANTAGYTLIGRLVVKTAKK